MDTSVFDHLGNKYESVSAMCRHYNIPVSTFYNRRKHHSNNYTLEQALTLPADPHRNAGMKCEDHLGNKFKSRKQMCEYWGVSSDVYFGRRGLGWSLEDALTRPLDYNSGAPHVFDHLGQEFDNEGKMCDHWNIKRSTYRERRKRGWDLERALIGNINDVPRPEDHVGEERYANCGLKMQIVSCEGIKIDGKRISKKRNSYCVRFEDGTIVHNIRYSRFSIGRVGHPGLDPLKDTVFHNFSVNRTCNAIKIDDAVYYNAKCNICGMKDLMTPQQMIEHEKMHEEAK